MYLKDQGKCNSYNAQTKHWNLERGEKRTYQKSKQGDPFLLSDIGTQEIWILIKEENKDVCPASIRMAYHSNIIRKEKHKKQGEKKRSLKHEII